MQPGDLLPVRVFSVFQRAAWDEEWTLVPNIQVAKLIRHSGKGIDQAQLLYNAGRVLEIDGEGFANVEPLDLNGKFICLEITKLASEYSEEEGEAEEEDEVVPWRWYGYVVQDNRSFAKPEAEEARRPLDQTFVALGLEYLLTRRAIRGAWTVGAIKADGTSAGVAPQYVETPISFNEGRKGDLSILGNRTPDDFFAELTYHTFSGRPKEVAAWCAYDIIEYALEKFGPTIPHFRLQDTAGEENEVAAALLEIVPPSFMAEGRSIWDVINAFVGPHNGMDWTLEYDEDAHEGTQGPIIKIFSITPTEIELDDATIPPVAEDDIVDIDLDERLDATLTLTKDETARYGKVIVRGQRILVCGSFSPEDATLEKAWTDAQETAYLTISDNHEAKDIDRADSNVFRRFRLPHAWGWKVGNGEGPGEGEDAVVPTPINVKTNAEGKLTGDKLAQRTWGTTFSPFLPLKEVRGSTVTAEDEPFYRQPFGVVIYKHFGDEHEWCYLHGGSPDGVFSAVSIGFADQTSHILIASSNPWALGMNVINDGTAQTTLGSPEVDWTEMILTLAIRMDSVLQVEHVLNEDRPEELVINVPDAELWAIAPGTVLKIEPATSGDTDTILVRQQPNASEMPGQPDEPEEGDPHSLVILRDDSKRLRQIAAAAEAWLKEDRRPAVIHFDTIVFTWPGEDGATPLRAGTFLRNVAGGVHATNAPITMIEIDVFAQTTTMQTSYELPNFRLVTGEE